MSFDAVTHDQLSRFGDLWNRYRSCQGDLEQAQRELGLYMVKCHEATPFGKWGWLLDKLGIPRNTASRIMKSVGWEPHTNAEYLSTQQEECSVNGWESSGASGAESGNGRCNNGWEGISDEVLPPPEHEPIESAEWEDWDEEWEQPELKLTSDAVDDGADHADAHAAAEPETGTAAFSLSSVPPGPEHTAPAAAFGASGEQLQLDDLYHFIERRLREALEAGDIDLLQRVADALHFSSCVPDG